jgi:hypothetical protein
MIDTIIGGLIVALITGITILAYKKPKEFHGLLAFIAPLIIGAYVFLIPLIYSGIHYHSKSLEQKMSDTATTTFEDVKYNIEGLVHDINNFSFYMLIGIAIIVYIVLMLYLPALLKNDKK